MRNSPPYITTSAISCGVLEIYELNKLESEDQFYDVIRSYWDGELGIPEGTQILMCWVDYINTEKSREILEKVGAKEIFSFTNPNSDRVNHVYKYETTGNE